MGRVRLGVEIGYLRCAGSIISVSIYELSTPLSACSRLGFRSMFRRHHTSIASPAALRITFAVNSGWLTNGEWLASHVKVVIGTPAFSTKSFCVSNGIIRSFLAYR